MSRFDLTKEQIGDLLAGEPTYRVKQVIQALSQGLSPEEMTTLPKGLRQQLSSHPLLQAAFSLAHESATDQQATLKWLLTSNTDGARIEVVLMRYPSRVTVCVSSQAGCAMACSFCATGQVGFTRQLTRGEITEQIVSAARAARDRRWGRLSNVVFMGMGEPMANYENVLAALRRCHDDLALGARAFTISTVGVVPGIRKLAAEGLQVNLAVSLHAANDELRSTLVPLNRRYPLADIMAACLEYTGRTNRRISFEWALISGKNDRVGDAAELALLLRPLKNLAHVNLIPLNPTAGFAAVGSSREVVSRFKESLVELGVNTTIRDTRGRSLDGACGQLAGGAGVAVRRRLA